MFWDCFGGILTDISAFGLFVTVLTSNMLIDP